MKALGHQHTWAHGDAKPSAVDYFAAMIKTARATPSLLQREKRTKTAFQLPYRSGISRHGAPVRRTQRMPLTVRCLSATAGPRSPFWDLSNGAGYSRLIILAVIVYFSFLRVFPLFLVRDKPVKEEDDI